MYFYIHITSEGNLHYDSLHCTAIVCTTRYYVKMQYFPVYTPQNKWQFKCQFDSRLNSDGTRAISVMTFAPISRFLTMKNSAYNRYHLVSFFLLLIWLSIALLRDWGRQLSPAEFPLSDHPPSWINWQHWDSTWISTTISLIISKKTKPIPTNFKILTIWYQFQGYKNVYLLFYAIIDMFNESYSVNLELLTWSDQCQNPSQFLFMSDVTWLTKLGTLTRCAFNCIFLVY